MPAQADFERYRLAVAFIESLVNLPREHEYMKPGGHTGVYLKRTQYLLDLLGNPEKEFKYIHITGTAGKGSVSNMAHSCLVAEGKNAGLYTSPFSTTTIEKIKVGNKYISAKAFADIVEYKIKPALDIAALNSPYGHPSYFEICFAIALLYFKNMKCEWAVIEVGCGGRFDATNIIPKPKITALTNVDYDHTQFLGKTLKKIAYEKAGIIKRGCAFWTTEQRPHILKILKSECKKVRTQYNQIKKTTGATYQDLNQTLVKNVCESIGLKKEAINGGVKNSFIPCRFETVQNKPLVIVDGAHNDIKIKSTVLNLKKIHYEKLHLIFTAAGNKELYDMAKLLFPLVDYFYLTRFLISPRKCSDPKDTYALAKKCGRKNSAAKIFLDPDHAMATALKKASPKDCILITGSFFLAGHLRKHWFSEDFILKNRQGK